MLIRDWMTKDPVTVPGELSMLKATRLMKEKNIRRLPVVDENDRLIGIVTDRDLRTAQPSKATSLDMHELYYLLSEIKIKDIMTKDPLAIPVNDTLERAAWLMAEKRIGGVPVIDENRLVVGVLTESDLFRMLVQMTGVRRGGVQMGFLLQNRPGALMEVLQELRTNGASVSSVLTPDDAIEAKEREVYVRMHPMERGIEDKIVAHMQERFNMLYWVRDNVHTTEEPKAD